MENLLQDSNLPKIDFSQLFGDVDKVNQYVKANCNLDQDLNLNDIFDRLEAAARSGLDGAERREVVQEQMMNVLFVRNSEEKPKRKKRRTKDGGAKKSTIFELEDNSINSTFTTQYEKKKSKKDTPPIGAASETSTGPNSPVDVNRTVDRIIERTNGLEIIPVMKLKIRDFSSESLFEDKRNTMACIDDNQDNRVHCNNLALDKSAEPVLHATLSTKVTNKEIQEFRLISISNRSDAEDNWTVAKVTSLIKPINRNLARTMDIEERTPIPGPSIGLEVTKTVHHFSNQVAQNPKQSTNECILNPNQCKSESGLSTPEDIAQQLEDIFPNFSPKFLLKMAKKYGTIESATNKFINFSAAQEFLEKKQNENKNVQEQVSKTLLLLREDEDFKKVTLTEKRNIDLDDPLENKFRLAKGHYLAMAGQFASQIESIGYVENRKLLENFEKKKNEFRSEGKEIKEYFLFHGTNCVNVDNILKDNFRMDFAGKNGQAYGRGVYFSEKTLIPNNYMVGTKKMLLLCRVLLGREFLDNGRRNIPKGFDSKSVNPDKEKRANINIIKDVDQILPCFVLNLAPQGRLGVSAGAPIHLGVGAGAPVHLRVSVGTPVHLGISAGAPVHYRVGASAPVQLPVGASLQGILGVIQVIVGNKPQKRSKKT